LTTSRYSSTPLEMNESAPGASTKFLLALRRPALSSFRTEHPSWGCLGSRDFEKREAKTSLKHSYFQNLGLIISNDTKCEFTSLFARTCTKVNSNVVFLQKVFYVSPLPLIAAEASAR